MKQITVILFFIILICSSFQKKPIKKFNQKQVELQCLKPEENFQYDFEYVHEQPYNINSILKNDSLYIYFKFVSACCQEFKKVVKYSNDTLYLDYKNSNHIFCDCLGVYDYVFKIAKCNVSTIYIKKVQVK